MCRVTYDDGFVIDVGYTDVIYALAFAECLFPDIEVVEVISHKLL